jgi:hypothetical protein
MKLSELILAVGDEHILVEPVAHNLDGNQTAIKGGLKITLVTRGTTLIDLVSHKPKMVGLLIWLPAERLNAASVTLAARADELANRRRDERL